MSVSYDPDTVKAKYLAERDKRLVAGRTDIRDLSVDEYFASFSDDPFTPRIDRHAVRDEVDVTIIGAGIAGLVAGAQLRRAGIEKIRIIDKAGGVGGTWYWNRYPGVMCDVESYIYIPMLEEIGYIPQRRYASGAEIRTCLERLADKFALTEDALLHTGVTQARWDDTDARWHVTTDRGDEFTSRYYVMAVGLLNLLKLPAIAGMEDFAGHSFHTARWDYAYTGGAEGAPLTNLKDKTVALIGTGATGIQCLPALAEGAKHVYVFQRTPSAVGVRGNRDTDPSFVDTCTPGWQKARMDNFQMVMLGREVEADLTDDGWTQHYAKVHNAPRWKGMTIEEYMLNAETIDYGIMEEHRSRVDAVVRDPSKAAILKPYYRYLCKRPCFHDDYLDAYNNDNVTLVDCPAGFDKVTAQGPVVNGHQYDVDCIVYGTGFEPEVTPLYRRAGHEVVGRGGVTLAEKFADGPSTYFGMLTRNFPNMVVMPSPGQQGVVTVNYTQLAVLGAEFVAGLVSQLEERRARAFNVSEAAETKWVEEVVASFVDPSHVMGACTPSRINNEGNPAGMNPKQANHGRGFGDYFAYRDQLEGWLAEGSLDGLEVE